MQEVKCVSDDTTTILVVVEGNRHQTLVLDNTVLPAVVARLQAEHWQHARKEQQKWHTDEGC